MVKENEVLIAQIEQLTKEIKTSNSARRMLYMSVIWGVGTAIGATVVAGIVILILSRVITTIEDVPILNNIIQSFELNDLLN